MSSGPTKISTVSDDFRYLEEVLVRVYYTEFQEIILIQFSLEAGTSVTGRLGGFGIRAIGCHRCGPRGRFIEVGVQEAAFSFLVGIDLNS